ncbi:MAG: OsmC family protein [Chloroflexota bacterium]|nr:OsmC family protein [Chloroflexota bacterium]
MTTHAKVILGAGLTTTVQMRGFTLTADEPIEDGGTNLGPKPTELLLAALGSCAAITARLYAQRKAWDLQGVEIDLTTERFKKEDYPTYTGDAAFVREFVQRITFTGNLTAEQKQRLTEIAGKCPVHRAFTDPQVMIETWVDQTIAEEME